MVVGVRVEENNKVEAGKMVGSGARLAVFLSQRRVLYRFFSSLLALRPWDGRRRHGVDGRSAYKLTKAPVSLSLSLCILYKLQSMLPIALFALCAFSLASAKLTPIVVRHRSLPSRDFLLAPRGLVRPTTGRIPKLRDPAELASGSLNVAGGCRNWWLVERGETCSSVAERNAISFEQFRAWNPAIDERCFNLYAGQAYCVLAPKTVSLPPVSTAVVAPQPTPSAGSNTSPQVYTGDATYFKACVNLFERIGRG